jgi:isopenicillin-N N-acyltransferase-like protein
MTSPRRPHAPLHFVELTGASHLRGLQHGELLRAPIARAVDFYHGFFARYLHLDTAEVRRRAARFVEPTARTSPLLTREIEGVAGGSGRKLEDIFMLCGRYELVYETVALGECSNVFVGPSRSRDGHTLLAESWEWRPEVLDFRAVLTARCDDGPDHIVVTECGQPGKYGLNQHGLGVTATGLCCDAKTSTGKDLVVVVARELLARPDFAAAAEFIRSHAPRATCSVYLADDQGQAIHFEAAPGGLLEKRLDPAEVSWHTNHCLLTDEPCTFADSLVRGRRWAELTTAPAPVSRETVQAWLADSQNGYYAICKPPDPAQSGTVTWLQTMCGFVMDLNERALWVADGLASEQPFRHVGLDRP